MIFLFEKKSNPNSLSLFANFFLNRLQTSPEKNKDRDFLFYDHIKNILITRDNISSHSKLLSLHVCLLYLLCIVLVLHIFLRTFTFKLISRILCVCHFYHDMLHCFFLLNVVVFPLFSYFYTLFLFSYLSDDKNDAPKK